MAANDCLFCEFAEGVMKPDLVFEDDRVMAFRDINPQAPTHVLVIPRKHISSLAAAEPSDEGLLGYLMAVTAKIAKEEKLDANGYRTVLNTGVYGGQTVAHIHVHLLGGRSFRWPPG